MLRQLFTWLMLGTMVALLGVDARGQGKPEGQLIIAFDTTLAPTYFDPAETPGTATPFVFLYALHDALMKPLPGNDMAPCLAESWTESPDRLVYEFKLREGLSFHHGEPFTAEDVKFSFRRYKGSSARLLQDKVKAVEVIDAHRIRFVRQDPGVELVLEANEQYWRKVPSIQRIIFKGVPERPTRLAMWRSRRRAVFGYGSDRQAIAKTALLGPARGEAGRQPSSYFSASHTSSNRRFRWWAGWGS